MSAFAVLADGRVLARFDETESQVLGSLSRQFSALLDDVSDPAALLDPAVKRLFPDAYRDDAAASEEFRRYTHRDLAVAKAAAATTVQSGLDGVADAGGGSAGAEADDGDPRVAAGIPDGIVLDANVGWQWLRHLADLRLTLAARLGVVDDPDAFAEEADPEVLSEEELLTRSLFDWIGYVQELLIAALEEATAAGDDEDAVPGPSSPTG